MRINTKTKIEVLSDKELSVNGQVYQYQFNDEFNFLCITENKKFVKVIEFDNGHSKYSNRLIDDMLRNVLTKIYEIRGK